LPAGHAAAALRCGRRVIPGGAAEYRAQIAALVGQLAHGPDYPAQMAAKTRALAAAHKQRPLAAYRAAELAVMNRTSPAPANPNPQLRRAFVYKYKPTETPPHLTRPLMAAHAA